MCRSSILLLAVTLGATGPAAGQQPGPAAPAGGAPSAPKRIQASAVSGGAPRVDGRLDDEAWRSARFVSDFVEREPNEGSEPKERTEVAFLYDDDALYIGARMHSTDPAGVRALVGRRDRESSSEQLIVSLDTYRDRRTAYTFAVSAGGVRVDYYHPSDNRGSRDYSYDPVWEAETALDSLGWTAEIRVPFTQLRFNRAGEQSWGLNIVRQTPARNEESHWVLLRRTDTGWASRMGELAGIRGIRPSRRIEALPYVASDATLAGRIDDSDPFAERREAAVRAGGDLKVGLGPSFTLDATFNPDFGQVEADPSEVNLTAFETFFSERRPFFAEGTQLFGGRGNFYSRRIGAPPIRPPAPYAELPANATILGAAKVSGRLPSGFSAGVLTAVTDRESARTFDPARDSFGRLEVAPRAGYGIVSLQQEFGKSRSTANLMLTGVERDLDPASFLSALLARRAYTGITDVRIRWAGGKYDMSAYWGFSWLQGDSLAILAQQRSSRRYFQRPDADYVEVDPSRTTLFGHIFGINHSKMAGKHWLWDIDYVEESPGYELNDVGRLGSADDRGLFANLRYRETTPGKVFRSYEIGVFQASEWNFGGARQFTVAGIGGNLTWKNFWTTGFEAAVQPRSQSDNLTRGGPLMATAFGGYISAGISNASSARTRWRVNAALGDDDLGGWNANASGGVTLRPGARWELSLDPRYFEGTTSRQYVQTRPGGPQETFGSRYIFSFVDRSEIAARIRLNYALTPKLTLETYAEPFASSGRFYDFGELAAPRWSDLRTYGTDGTTITPQPDGSRVVTDGTARFTIPNLDFNVRSFRSNGVLRWEWRPGSTLFLVWQQDRFARDPFGDAVGPAGLLDALRADGNHYLALKVNYWLPID